MSWNFRACSTAIDDESVFVFGGEDFPAGRASESQSGFLNLFRHTGSRAGSVCLQPFSRSSWGSVLADLRRRLFHDHSVYESFLVLKGERYRLVRRG